MNLLANAKITNINNVAFTFKYAPFIIGLISTQKVVLGGEIYIGELLALAYLLFNFTTLKIEKSLKIVILLGMFWALCQLLSDQLNKIDFLDSIKGVGAPLFFISTIAAVSMYFGLNINRMPSFIIGIYFGYIPGFLFNPSLYFEGNPWKWGLGSMILGVFGIYFTFFKIKKNELFLIFFVIVFLIMSLNSNARSLGVFPLLSAITFILLRKKIFAALLNQIDGKNSVLKLIFIVVTLIVSMNLIFTAIFSSSFVLNALSEESASKIRSQASGDYGLLLGGRTEVFASINAFLDKPLLGHGSWAKDNSGYNDLMFSKLIEAGYADRVNLQTANQLIPVHSYLMGSLVWSGIGGGLFWLYVLRWLILKFILNFQLIGFYFYNGFILIIWNILFSPFGASARWDSAVFIAALSAYTLWLSRYR